MSFRQHIRQHKAFRTLGLAIVATVVLVAVLCGCSTKHNTWYSRNYQKLTSHYNVFYNARTAFESGIESVRKATKNDYSHVLPVYEFANAQAAGTARADMETTLKKSHKLVQLHSITVKPERKEHETAEDKRFRAKEEFNPYVGEGLLLIGKANVVLHDEQEAMKFFDYLARKHETERPSYEGKIWQAIAYCQMGQYNNAVAALRSYDMDGVAPTNLYAEYQAAYANIFICQEQYAEAIPYMAHAAAEIKDRHLRRRYQYILAQLYRETGDKAKAAPLFLALSKGLSDFDMAFAAKMDLATVATTDEELAKAEKTLRKMSTNPNYEEQMDQIFYSIGKMEENKGNMGEAVKAFNQSVAKSVSNDNQKGLSFLALADIYQSRPQYIEASTALDSAAIFLDESNSRKEESRKRAALLAPLAKELRTIRDNDSVMNLAKMDGKSREKFLKDMVRQDEERREAQRAAKEEETLGSMSQSEYYQIANSGGSQKSSWYFYNTQLVTAGKSTFRTKWGNRRNEDNWRRSDKSVQITTPEERTTPEESDSARRAREMQEELERREANQPLSYEKLLAGLPLTKEAQDKKNEETARALFRSGNILYDDIHDYDRTIEQLTELMRRYPDSPYRCDALTLLHFAQAKAGDSHGQQQTDADILRLCPEGDMAKNLKNANYLGEMQARHDAHERLYQETYAAYLRGDNGTTMVNASKALDDAGTEEEYRPRYLLLRAMANAKQANTSAMRADLEQIGQQYPSTPQDSLAKLLLAELDKGRTPIRSEAYESPLDKARNASGGMSEQHEDVHYEYQPDSVHIVVCIVDNGKLRDAQFKIADYNFSNYILQDYDLVMKHLPGDKQAIIIRDFPNAKEAKVYFYAIREQAFWKEVSSAPLPEVYTMSEQNYSLMGLTGIDEAFLEFYKEHYAQ